MSFTDPQCVKVADLQVGDFVVSYPAQANLPARTINSTIETLDDEYDAWSHQSARRRPKLPVHSRRATFVTRTVRAMSLPASCDVIVRRPIAEVQS